MTEERHLNINGDPILCDVVEGCPNPVVDCIGGEVWYCSDHETASADVFWEWQKEKVKNTSS
jgi:hypothetical protein